MRNIWITVSYEGTDYGGFQRQENRMTVQEMLENCLLELTKKKTTIYFVARTDAGVHLLYRVYDPRGSIHVCHERYASW